MPRLTGGEIIARTLTNYGVEHAAGIPGHGVWALLDGFLQEGCTIPITQVFHEQSAVHMADGYWRATGRPMAVLTSIGPGAVNTVMCRARGQRVRSNCSAASAARVIRV